MIGKKGRGGEERGREEGEGREGGGYERRAMLCTCQEVLNRLIKVSRTSQGVKRRWWMIKSVFFGDK